MKLVVYGATGGTGKNVVERALAAGHDVVAAARRPEAVTLKHAKLTVAKVDVHDAAQVAASLSGADAAILAIGPAKNSQPGTVISDGAKHVVLGCKQAGVKRVVLESGMMVSDGAELSFVGSTLLKLVRTFFRKLYEDKVVAEAAVTSSGLEWVIVRPPNLNHDPAKGGYVAAPKANISLAKAIAHADCAEVLVKAATTPEWVGQVVNVGYG